MKDETREKLREWFDAPGEKGVDLFDSLAAFVESAVQSARNEALENAAETVDCYTKNGRDGTAGYNSAIKDAVKAVRALKTDGTK